MMVNFELGINSNISDYKPKTVSFGGERALRKKLLKGLLGLTLFLSMSNLTFGEKMATDVEKDGYKGRVKSIESFQVAMAPDPTDPNLYNPKDDPKLVYQVKYNENGIALHRLISFKPVNQPDMPGFNMAHFNYVEYIAAHPQDLVNCYDYDTMGEAVDYQYEYNNRNVVAKMFMDTYAQNGTHLLKLLAVNKLDGNQIAERDILNTKNNELIFKLIYKYMTNKTKPVTKSIVVESYWPNGTLRLQEKFIIGAADRVIAYSSDRYSTTNLIYDQKGHLVEMNKGNDDSRNKEFMLKYTRDKDGNLVELFNKSVYGTYMVKYEYEYDKMGNPQKIKVYASAEKFGKMIYEPLYQQVNTITYYN